MTRSPASCTPVNDDLLVFGITADIGDVGSSWKGVASKRSGLMYLIYGPTLMMGGELFMLEQSLMSLFGSIDLASKTLKVTSLDLFNPIPGLFEIDGSISLSADLEDAGNLWVALGGFDMQGCVVTIFDGFFNLIGGFRLNPLQGYKS